MFHKSKVPIGVMLYILTNLQNKSIKQLSEELDYSRVTIHKIAKKFKESLLDNHENPKIDGEIEIDEIDKPIIITIIARNSKYTIFHVAKKLSKKLIWELISKLYKKNIEVFTDDFKIYSHLNQHNHVKKHESINHSIKEYANGKIHVNKC